jgi:hypothetical protein
MELDKYLLYSRNITSEEIKLLFLSSLTSFSHSFGDEEDIGFIIDKVYESISNISDLLKKPILLSNLYKYGTEENKNKSFEKIKYFLESFFKLNSNPILRLRALDIFFISINNLYIRSDQKVRENVSRDLTEIKKIKIGNIQEAIRNKNILVESEKDIDAHIESLKKGELSAKAKREIIVSLSNLKDEKEKESIKKFVIESSLIFKQTNTSTNEISYSKLNKRYYNLLHSFDYDSFNLETAKYFLYILSAIREIGGKYKSADLEKKQIEMENIFEHLDKNQKLNFMFQLGFLNPRNSEKTISRLYSNLDLKKADRTMFFYGVLCAKEGILPPDDISISLDEKDIWDIDLQTKDYLTKINSNFYNPVNWENFIILLKKICKLQPCLLPHLISSLIIIRALKKQPSLLSGTINIEHLAREFNLILEDLAFNENFIGDFLWLTKIIYSSFPTSQNIITEYRTTAWNWYKEVAEITHKADIEQYEGIEKQMIYYFHDSPGPFHLEIMEAYTDLLLKNDQFSFDSTRDLLKKININIPRDYVKKLGTNLESVQYASQKLLNIFREIYGPSSTKLLFEKIKSSNLNKEVEKKLFYLSNKLTKYNLDSKKDITQKIISRSEMFSPEDYSIKDKMLILQELSNLIELITTEIKSQRNKKEIVNMIAIQNCLEGIAYQFLFEIINHVENLDQNQILGLVGCGLKIMQPFMSNYLNKEADHIIKETYNKNLDSLKVYSLLKRAEKTINNTSSWYVHIFQEKAKIMSYLNKEVSTNITADILRETPLFPLSELIIKLIGCYSLDLKIEKDHITNIGENEGRVIYISKEQIKDHIFKGEEILLTEDIDTHANLPLIKGIITKVQHPPLSHIALMARERKMPWYTPSLDEFEKLKKEAIRNKNKKYQIRVFIGQCNLNPIKETKSLKKEKKFSEFDLIENIDTEKWIISEQEYQIETVGSKAYHLSLLSKLFPEKIPVSLTLTFGFFQELIDKNKVLAERIFSLRSIRTKDNKGQLREELRKIREIIGKIKIEPQKIQKIKREIESLFKNSDKIIVRSSTNAEDLAGHSAAGVYESIVTTKENIGKTILEVFSSFYTLKAWEDRRFALFNEKTCHMAVIIQKLMTSDYSFVVHTVSPLTYKEDEILLEIVPGLGESLVSGEPQFMGASHQFVYNKKKKTIKRLSYITKSMKKIPGREGLINPSEDLFNISHIPYPKLLKKIFLEAEIIERELPKLKYGKRGCKPQDIEGLIITQGVIKRNKKAQKLQVYYVQTRNQYIPQIKRFFSGKIKKEILEDKNPIRYSLKMNNTILEKSYEFSKTYFDTTKKANLIEIMKKVIKEVVGEGKVIIQPVGSSYYLAENGKLFWDKIKDIDMLLYFIESKTKYDAYKMERLFLDKIKNKFHQAIKEKGLIIYSNPVLKYLDQAIEKAKVIRANSEKMTFGQNFNAESFFERIKFYPQVIKKDELNNSFRSRIEDYLSTKKISEKYNVYYSLKFDKNSDYPNLVIASFLKAYFDNTKLYAPVFWDWEKTSEVLYKIFMKLGFINKNMSRVDFLENVIKKYLEYNLIPQIAPFNADEVEKNYPGMKSKIAEGWTQAIIHYLNGGGRVDKKGIIIRDHIDNGSISSILCLLAEFFDDKKNILNILQAADNLKLPVPTDENLKRRLEGDLYGAQLFLNAIKKILKPIKENMNESQAIEYMKKEPISNTNTLDLLLDLVIKTAKKEYGIEKKYSSESMAQLTKEYAKIKSISRQRIKGLFEYSKNKKVAALSDAKGIKDLEIKYLLLDKGTYILVQYQEIRNNANKLRGYRYSNVGTNPLVKNVSLIGLMEILSAIEMMFNTVEKSQLTRQNLWAGHSRPDVMITGPSCGDFDSCSLIPPKELVEIIELFLDYKRTKKLEYSALNYEKNLPEKFLKAIYGFLYQKEIMKKIADMAKQIININSNSEIVNEIDSFIIQQQRPKIKFISCGKSDLRVMPIGYFLNPYSMKTPWWDKVPKGLNSWSTYYGDDKALQILKNKLKDNEGNVTFEYLVEGELKEINMRRIGGKLNKIENKKEALEILKEIIRVSRFMNEEKILKKAYNLLETFDDSEESRMCRLVLILFNELDNISQDKLLKKIYKNVKKICIIK